MQLVDQSHRQEQQAETQVEFGAIRIFQMNKLGRYLTDFTSGGMFEFELGIQQPVIIELISYIDNRSEKVRPVAYTCSGTVVFFRREIVVHHLAVPADRDPAFGAIDF